MGYFGRPITSDPKIPEMWGVNPKNWTGEPDKQCSMKLDTGLRFLSETGSMLYPGYVLGDSFKTKFRAVMSTLQAYKAELNYWKSRDPDYVGLSHTNLNVDNAYFWRRPDGTLDCGVLDWGGLGQTS